MCDIWKTLSYTENHSDGFECHCYLKHLPKQKRKSGNGFRSSIQICYVLYMLRFIAEQGAIDISQL